MKPKKKCYIYTRVSTSMQVDGYSLDAQKDKLRKYAEFQEFEIAWEYSDEGIKPISDYHFYLISFPTHVIIQKNRKRG